MPRTMFPNTCEVLALVELARGSGCGFEVHRRVAAKLAPAPPPAMNTFYYALQRLVKDGLAVRTKEHVPLRRGRTGQPRKFFLITEEGRREAQRLSDGLRATLLPLSTQKV